MNVYTTIDGVQYGPLTVTNAELVHRVGLVDVEMADGSMPTGERYLSPTKTYPEELFPRTMGYWRLEVAP